MDNFDYKKFLAEGKLYEETEALDRESVVDMAQMVADEFTKEDALGDKFSTYMVYKVGKVDGLEFELDTVPTEQTPAEEIKYGAGEGMGGIFRINVLPNGYEVRNVEKGGLVATMDMENGFKMLSAAESRAELDDELDYMMKEGEETKSNKMKKSELKEMIRAAMLAETQVEETLVDADQDMAEAILNALGGEAAFEAVVRAMSTDDAQTYLGAIMRDHDIEMGPVGDIPGFEGTMDALDSLSLREEEEDEEVELEADVEDTEVEDAGEIDVEANAEVGITGDKKEVQDNLEAALEAAKALGDQKLADQIGNSITFFTRTHVVGKDQVAEDLSMVRMLKNAGVKK
jgi:hypothetical protein